MPTPFRTGGGSLPRTLNVESVNATGASLLGPDTTAALQVSESGAVTIKGSNNTFICEGNSTFGGDLEVLGGPVNVSGTTALNGNVKMGNVVESGNGHAINSGLEVEANGAVTVRGSSNTLLCENDHQVTGDCLLNTAGTGTVTYNNLVASQHIGTAWVMGLSSYLPNDLNLRHTFKIQSNGTTTVNSPVSNARVKLNVNRQAVLTVARISNVGEVDVTGNITMTGGSTAVTHISTSDDRLKWNETPIQNALETIRKLSPQTYDKAHSIPEDGLQPEYTSREAGLIAQEVLQIPELAQFVKPDGVVPVEVPATDAENAAIDEARKALTQQKAVEAAVRTEEDEERIAAEAAVTAQLEARLAEAEEAAVHPDTSRIKPFSLDYNSIFTHMIAAIQELDTIVQTQQNRIEILERQ